MKERKKASKNRAPRGSHSESASPGLEESAPESVSSEAAASETAVVDGAGAEATTAPELAAVEATALDLATGDRATADLAAADVTTTDLASADAEPVAEMPAGDLEATDVIAAEATAVDAVADPELDAPADPAAEAPADAAATDAANTDSPPKSTRASYAIAAECTVADAGSLKSALAKLLDHPDPVTLDISAVQRIDTAGVQVITAFVRERASHRRLVEWQGAAPAFSTAVRLLGLDSALNVPELS